MRTRVPNLVGSIVLLTLAATAVFGQTAPQAAPKKGQPSSSEVVIRGTLVNEDKTPFPSSKQDPQGKIVVYVVPATTTPKGGQSPKTVRVETSGLKVTNMWGSYLIPFEPPKHAAHPDAKGVFAIKLPKSSFPGKKLVLVVGPPFVELERDGSTVILEIVDSTSVFDLGTIVVK